MKRIGNLYDRIISMENLRRAESKARRGKTHTFGVRDFDKAPEAKLQALHEALLTGTYKTSPYEVFTVFEPKERLIYRLPYYPDRIVHHAIMNVLEPIWVSVFPYNTYSCIKDRGIEGARKRVRKILSDPENSRYCLKIDIKKFYPSVRHDVIKAIYRRKIKCPKTLRLLDEIVDSVNGAPSPIDPTGVCHGRSIPIGNYISQYLANLSISYLIHEINHKFPTVKGVVYADDGRFYAADKEILHRLLAFIRNGLKKLDLELKGNYQIFPVAKNRYYPKRGVGDKHGRGDDYLGYRFYHKQTMIRKNIKRNFCRRVASLLKRATPLPPAEFKMQICSWLGWVKYSNSEHLLKTIISNSNYYGILRPQALKN